MAYLRGSVIDFDDGLHGKGFEIQKSQRPEYVRLWEVFQLVAGAGFPRHSLVGLRATINPVGYSERFIRDFRRTQQTNRRLCLANLFYGFVQGDNAEAETTTFGLWKSQRRGFRR